MDRLSGIPHLSVMRDCIIFVTTGVWESGNDAYDVMNCVFPSHFIHYVPRFWV
jgi:hypothetical protein